ncbi:MULTISPECIES: PPC domain-containing protein [unclassified Bacillus (in: firmicutes)]|uniref:PPC domain-containing protein n=1 Tax=unclassified Bacillus (in: firmicutes) TaxID=185979 RepID=UPI001BEB25E0|nr:MULTISPECIES: PPC domain-containing protein [unclassified Bacillus (in: firmicutes)]MBT2618465.1 hypothetical protein [Bacillus sp. ISL-78]MBT2630670.1 hypothetical protein [Bacillus sp. ISL-101]MBT2718746.1 hypothetical protein [Bacillus sp. ISL-57]
MKKYLMAASAFLGVLCLILVSGALKVSANVGQDSLQAAKPINVNAVNQAIINENGDYEDYWKFTLTKPGQVTFNMNNYSGYSWGFEILDANGYVFTDGATDNSSKAMGVTARKVGLPAGTYYVHIMDDWNSYNEIYYFSVNFAENANMEYEFNDSSSTANKIKLNTPYLGEIQKYDDEDYYRLTLPESGAVTLNMSQKTGIQWNTSILTLEGEVLSEFTTDDSSNVTKPTERTVGLPKGEYLIHIRNDWHYNSTYQPYTFIVKFAKSTTYEKEFNDNAHQANSIGVGKNYYGNLQDFSDTDYFTFSLSKPSSVSLEMGRKPSVSWDMSLYNSNGDELGSFNTKDDQFAKGIESMRYSLPAGRYYISVDDYRNTGNNKYQLAVKVQTPSISSKSVQITNYVGKSDSVKVSALAKGDVVKLFDSKGKIFATSKPASGSSTTFSIKQLGKNAGFIYVSNTKSGMLESSRVKVSFKAEPKTPKPSASNITIKNNKGKSDTVIVKGLKKSDVVKLYSSSGKYLSSKTSNSSSATITVKQLGKGSGSAYVTVTRPGMNESDKVKKTFKAE